MIIPTRYPQVPTEHYESLGVSLVIWANHLLPSSINAMQDTARSIHEERSLEAVEHRIAPVAEVFRLQNADELTAAEARFLPDR